MDIPDEEEEDEEKVHSGTSKAGGNDLVICD